MRYSLKRQYKIYRVEYVNTYYDKTSLHFTIKERKHFLFIPYWSFVKEENCKGGKCRKEVIQFESANEARSWIRNAKDKNYKRDRWHSMVLEKITI